MKIEYMSKNRTNVYKEMYVSNTCQRYMHICFIKFTSDNDDIFI